MSELKIIKRAIPYNRSTKHSILNECTNLYRRGRWWGAGEGGRGRREMDRREIGLRFVGRRRG